jgi:hypothetical protein
MVNGGECGGPASATYSRLRGRSRVRRSGDRRHRLLREAAHRPARFHARRRLCLAGRGRSSTACGTSGVGGQDRRAAPAARRSGAAGRLAGGTVVRPPRRQGHARLHRRPPGDAARRARCSFERRRRPRRAESRDHRDTLPLRPGAGRERRPRGGPFRACNQLVAGESRRAGRRADALRVPRSSPGGLTRPFGRPHRIVELLERALELAREDRLCRDGSHARRPCSC